MLSLACGLYNCAVPRNFHIGDFIRVARKVRKWNQEKLGLEAARFPIDKSIGKIDKSTVSKVEKEPFTSELGTVWRLLAALGCSFADAEQQISKPFPQQYPANSPPGRKAV
jgi:hypothetical protein